MAKASPKELGEKPIGSLLIKQAIPASIGILAMSLNILVDSIFVGNWIGPTALAAINVVLPVSFFIGAIGMSIGVGGSSVLSRALGAKDDTKALKTFGNQISLTLLVCVSMVVFGLLFMESLIPAFGGLGAIYEPARVYYEVVLYGVPFLALCMMGNTVIRAEGQPRHAMIAMIIPSIANLVLDVVFIYYLDLGMLGAAWATTAGYFFCFAYVLFFFLKHSNLAPKKSDFSFDMGILKEMSSLSFVTLSRQAISSVIYLIMNTLLFRLGAEALIAVYAIIGRMLMFALFPVFGVTQGFLPIAGYNYGAKLYDRVRESITKAILYASGVATLVFIFLFVFPAEIAALFLGSGDNLSQEAMDIRTMVIEKVPIAMRWVFGASPIIAIQLIGAGYFQAIGKVKPALWLTLLRQGLLLMPLLFILPPYLGEKGVWQSFFFADVLATLITAYFLYREITVNLSSVSE